MIGSGMARNTWKIVVGSSVGIEASRAEVETAEEALAVVQNAMQKIVKDPGADIRVTFDATRMDAVEA